MTVGIIGATGYVGAELLRLLLRHPNAEKIVLSSVTFYGQNMEDVYPNFRGLLAPKCDGVLLSADEVLNESQIIFTALPHGIAESYAVFAERNGKKLIDLSADFRFDDDEKTFVQWYKKNWEHPEIHKKSVYGLPEMNRDLIKNACIVGNPGCYVTAITLALLPALKNQIILPTPIIADCKSGVTGAGREPSAVNSFSECGESCGAYAVGSHRHQPETERNLTKIAGKPVSFVFTPHLLPMSRGIIATMYAPLCEDFIKNEKNHNLESSVHALYTDCYRDEQFVRILPQGQIPKTKNVRNTNFCDISVHIVQNGSMLQVVSVLDNMVKGASGQAVQNMNILCGFNENTGLDAVPAAF